MARERWWSWFVDAVAVGWLCLFVVDTAVSVGLLALSSSTSGTVRLALQWLFLVFAVDLALLYRWSDDDLRTFVRSNWFLILTVIPLFRPLRLLRAGRGLRVLRVLVQSRRLGALSNKVRRLWDRLRSRLSR